MQLTELDKFSLCMLLPAHGMVVPVAKERCANVFHYRTAAPALLAEIFDVSLSSVPSAPPTANPGMSSGGACGWGDVNRHSFR